MIKVEPASIQAYQLFHDGAIALSSATANGIHIDVDYCIKQEKHLERRIRYSRRKIEGTEIGKKWKKKYKSNFNLDSDDQMGDILFNEFDYEPQVRTEKGNASVSQAALEQLDIPIVEEILELRRLSKAKNTYLKAYIREAVDGFLHPFYHLDRLITYRSSSSKINFQNQPTRIPMIKKIVRRAVIPRPGHLIVEIDYSGAEVRVATCYHEDPEMIDEINNPEKDMHRDMAMKCYRLSLEEVDKITRYCGKNKFVFPEFYGSYYPNVAKDLWNAIKIMNLKTAQGLPLMKHLKKKGVGTYDKFEKHIEEVEAFFWGEKFPIYAQWKRDWYDAYLERGYFFMKTGFKCSGEMKMNEVVNYPVQGAAFHCLLWAFIQMTNWMEKNNLRSKMIGQIHDSMVLDIHPNELHKVLRMAKYIMTKKIREHYPWLIVPMEVEFEASPLDGSWYLKKEIFPHDCSGCGAKWMYKNIYDDGVVWECPICRRKEE
jgi:DNA polymerase-1